MNRRKFLSVTIGGSLAVLASKPALAEDKGYASALAKALKKGKKDAKRGVSLGIRG